MVVIAGSTSDTRSVRELVTRTLEVKSAWGSMTSDGGSLFLGHFAAFSPTTISFKSFEAQGDLHLEISR